MKKAKTMYDYEIVEKLCKIINKTVKAYRSDFYAFDLPTFYKMRHGEKRVLMIRETGTYFPLISSAETISAILESGADYKRFIIIEKHPDDPENAQSHHVFEYREISRADLEKMI